MATTEGDTEDRSEMVQIKNEETGPMVTAANDDENKPTTGYKGVLIICLCEIFGAIFFLRIPWIIGQAGISTTIMMIFLAMFISLSTILSMSIICQTGEIKSGGPYYIISRILGPTIGISIGSLYCLARTITISLYLIGFAETVVAMADPIITGNFINDVRIWSMIALFLTMMFIMYTQTSKKGIKLTINVLLSFLILIFLSIFLIFIGSFYKQIENEDNEIVVTSKGWSNGNFGSNSGVNYQDDYGFGFVFLILFLAFASLTVGADISGDLENASDNIPKGTLLSMCISIPIYILMVIFVGAVVVRDELLNNITVMFDICVWYSLGVFALYLTLIASAIIGLIAAEKIFSAIVNDGIFGIERLSNYKIRYFIIFVVAFIFCMIADLNIIYPLITQIFLFTNFLINCACFMLSMSKKNRNIYELRHKCISPVIAIIMGVIGGILSLVMMFWMNLIYAFIVLVVMLIFCSCFYGVKTRQLDWSEKENQYAISV